jgi:hypothetical protein
MATVLRIRLHDAKEIHHNMKQMEHLTSLLSLASLPKDTSALLQSLVNEPANSALNVMFYCFDPLADVDSAGFSSSLLQVLINCSTRKSDVNENRLAQAQAFGRNKGEHTKIMTMLLKLW